MHKMFIGCAKTIVPYALYNDCFVLVHANLRTMFENYSYKEKNNICSFIFEYDDNPAKLCFGRVKFSNLLDMASRHGFEYIAYSGEKGAAWKIEKLKELALLMKNDENRKKLSDKNPILLKPLDRAMESYSVDKNKYWKKIPLKELMNNYVRFLRTEDCDVYSFDYNDEQYLLNIKTNALIDSSGDVFEIEDFLINTLKLDINEIHAIVIKQFGIDLRDFVENIEYVDISSTICNLKGTKELCNQCIFKGR